MDLLLRASSLMPLLSLLAWALGLGVEGVTLYSTVGGSVNMSCQGSRDHQKYYFEWSFHQKPEAPVRIVNREQQITVRDPERAQRMSVGSDWSLHIHNLNTQDTGQYICEQYVNGHYYEPGRTTVDLYLLSSVTLYSTVGGSVNMSCQGSRDHQKYYFEWSFHQKPEAPVRIVNREQKLTVRDPERAQRMSVGSDWSLHIHSLNTQDTGLYRCEQNVNGQYFPLGRTTVDLYLLSISASPSGGLKTDTVLTLQCGLDCGGGFQSCAGEPADVQVTWESDHLETVDIREDRHFSSLSMKLQSSDHMRTRTCVLRERGVMKTSDTYTINLTDQSSGLEMTVRLTIFFIVLLVPVLLGILIFTKRRNSKVTEEVSPGIELQPQR